ncbi:MAG: fibronectin type III domain-containing protein [Suipraeoptans sp.]
MKSVKKYLRSFLALLIVATLGCTGSIGTLTANAAPAAPSGLRTDYYDMSGYQFTILQWSRVSNASGYRLYRANTENGDYILFYDGLGLSGADDHLMSDLTYPSSENNVFFYKIAAMVNGEETELSNAVCNRPELASTAKEPVDEETDESSLEELPTEEIEIVEPETKEPETKEPETEEAETGESSLEEVQTGSSTGEASSNNGLTAGELTSGSNNSSAGVGIMSMMTLNAVALQKTDISVTWEYDGNFDYFDVYRSETEDGEYELVAIELDNMYFRDSGLEEKKEYFYQIAVVYNDTEVLYGPVSATTNGELELPSNLTVTAKDTTTITVDWDAASGADYYEIYRSLQADDGFVMIAGPLVETTYEDTNLTPDTTYYYIVRAVQECETCGGIGPESATTMKVLGQPSNIQATATGTTTIDVEWVAAVNATSYMLYRSLTVDGTYEQIGGTITGTTYADTNLTPDTTYYYKVRSVGQEQISVYVGPANATTWKGLGNPASITATATGTTTIDVTWTTASNATSYMLYRSTSENGTYDQIGGTITGTTYNDTNLSPNTTYYYKVRSVGQGQIGDYVGPANATTWKVLGDPANIKATATGTSTITVTWTAASNATSYVLSRSTSANGTYTPIGGTITGTTYYDSGLLSGTTYYYKVYAVGQNQTSNEIGPANATTWKALGAPASIKATATGTSTITVNWDVGTNATSYKLYRSTSANGTYTQIGGTLTGTTYYDTGLTHNTTYYYKVRSVGQNQESGLVGPAHATTWKLKHQPTSYYPQITNACCRIYVNLVVNNANTYPTEIAGFELYMHTNQSEASPPSTGGWTLVAAKSMSSSTTTWYRNQLTVYAGNMLGVYPNRYHYKYRFRYTDGTYSEFSQIGRLTTLSGTFASCAGRNHGPGGWQYE